MRKGFWSLCFVMVALLLTNCATLPVSDDNLVEAAPQTVRDCERLGSVSEMADPGKIISVLDRNQMISRIKARAVELGATHIVWEYQTNDAASATAFRCRE